MTSQVCGELPLVLVLEAADSPTRRSAVPQRSLLQRIIAPHFRFNLDSRYRATLSPVQLVLLVTCEALYSLCCEQKTVAPTSHVTSSLLDDQIASETSTQDMNKREI